MVHGQSNLLLTLSVSLEFLYIHTHFQLLLQQSCHSVFHGQIDSVFETGKLPLSILLVALKSALEIAIAGNILVWVSRVLQGVLSRHFV